MSENRLVKDLVLWGECAEEQPPNFGGTQEQQMYPCEVTNTAAFVRQLAVSYVARGYWFYVTGTIPAHKDPRKTDAKIIRQYGIDMSKWTRWRRKKAGLANVRYLRHGHYFVIMATCGVHCFFESERESVQDIRRVPLSYAGYAVSCSRHGGKWRVSLRIARQLPRSDGERFVTGHRTFVTKTSCPTS